MNCNIYIYINSNTNFLFKIINYILLITLNIYFLKYTRSFKLFSSKKDFKVTSFDSVKNLTKLTALYLLIFLFIYFHTNIYIFN